MQDERWAEQRQDADVESKCNRECCHRYSCCKCCPWSFGKTCAILPFYPFFSMLAAVAGGLVLIFGMNTVARGSDAARLANGADIITFSSTLYIVAYGGVGTVALIDLILTYSVLTSKLRIHNICGRAECTGFMGTAESPAAKCLACVCKSSIYVVSVLAWLSALLSIAMLMLTTFIAAVALMVVYMCDIEPATINRLLLELQDFSVRANSNSFIGELFTVNNGTTSAVVCELSNKDTMVRGSAFILGGAPVLLVAQIVVLVSFNVVHESTLRHLKNLYRDTGYGERDVEMSRQRAANSVASSSQPYTAACAHSGKCSARSRRVNHPSVSSEAPPSCTAESGATPRKHTEFF